MSGWGKGQVRLAALLLCAGTLVAADFEWIHTARVFLIDAYEPPFATKLEFDAEALAKTMVAMNANTVRIATMASPRSFNSSHSSFEAKRCSGLR